MQLIRNHGEAVIEERGSNSHNDILGFNYRLTEIQAAIAVPQLNKLDVYNDARINMANMLGDGIGKFNFLDAPKVRSGCKHVYYLYPMLYNPDILGITRDTFITALKAEGINVSNYNMPLHLMRIFSKSSKNTKRCQITEDIEFNRIIVTNICRLPFDKNEIDEFIFAVDKLTDSVDDLLKWERQNIS